MNDVQAFGSTKSKRTLAEYVAYFCINEMMPRMETLDVCIHLDKLPEADGYCLAVTNREFQIEIEKTLDEEDFITAVCHEMVHVKQFAKGEMVDIVRANKIRWHGVDFDDEDASYYDQPWEIEAHGREMGLFVRWAQKKGYAKQKWTQYEDYR